MHSLISVKNRALKNALWNDTTREGLEEGLLSELWLKFWMAQPISIRTQIKSELTINKYE